MGGAKKASPAKAEKRQAGEAAKKEGTKSKKGKKDDKKSDDKSVKTKIRVILTDDQTSKVFKSAKVITAQDLSRQTGVKVSAANAYLIKSLGNGTVKRVGGHSGHYIYQFLSA